MLLTVTPNPCLHKTVAFKGGLDGRVVIRPVESWYQGGGKGINAARTIRTLGGEVRALTTSGGHVGRLFLDGLAAEGLAVDAVAVRRPTRMSTFVYSNDARQFREFLEPGAPLEQGEEEALTRRFLELLPQAELVLLCGSVPDTAQDGFHARCIEAARAAGKRVLLDTYGPAAVQGAAAAPWLFKANLDEVAASFGMAVRTDAERQAFASRLQDGGIEVVVLTAGAEGAWVHDARGVTRYFAPAVEEVNPVGSGDAMLGALATALARGEDLRAAVRLGCAAGSANAARLGVCDFTRAEVAALAERVVVS